MNFAQAREFALAAGVTDAEIDGHAIVFTNQVGTTPFRNMIVALQLHPWSNSREDWARLAGAMKARLNQRKYRRAA